MSPYRVKYNESEYQIQNNSLLYQIHQQCQNTFEKTPNISKGSKTNRTIQKTFFILVYVYSSNCCLSLVCFAFNSFWRPPIYQENIVSVTFLAYKSDKTMQEGTAKVILDRSLTNPRARNVATFALDASIHSDSVVILARDFSQGGLKPLKTPVT